MAKNGPAITLIICGTALALMPLIYAAVERANVLYARAIAAANDVVLDESGGMGAAWLAPVSVGLGVVMICVGVVLAVRRPTNG